MLNELHTQESRDYPNNIQKIEAYIAEIIKKVEDIVKNIPEFNFAGISSIKLKGDLGKMLDNVKECGSEVATINRDLEAVRNQIIDPVNKIIEKSSKDARKFNTSNLILGYIGLIIGVLGIPPYFYHGETKQQNQAQILTQNAKDQNESSLPDELIALLQGGDTQVYSSDIQIKVAELTHKAERIIQNRPSLITQELNSIRSDLLLLLKSIKSKIDEPTLFANVVYAVILCSSGLNNWNEVLRLAQFSDSKNLQNTTYGIAVSLYGAEAYSKMDSPSQALNSYGKFQNRAAKFAEAIILSPDTQEKETIKEIVHRRLGQLEFAAKISSSVFFIFDSKDTRRDEKLAEKLQKLGFKKATARGHWLIEFYQPVLYYKDEFLDKKNVLEQIKQQIKQQLKVKNLQMQHYKTSTGKSIREAFKTHSDLDFLVIL